MTGFITNVYIVALVMVKVAVMFAALALVGAAIVGVLAFILNAAERHEQRKGEDR